MKKKKMRGLIVAAMTLAVAATSIGFNGVTANAYTSKIEFEKTNKFSRDRGNSVRRDQFKGYSGNGYVYLAKGWAEVNFNVPSNGNYNITIVSNSDQHKQNYLYLDNNSAGTLSTNGGKWNRTTKQYYLSKGSHKFGVSSDWGHVALDYVIVQSANNNGGNNGGTGNHNSGGSHSSSVPSKTSRGMRAGTEHVSGISRIKKEIYKAGGDDIAVAVAMLESRTMDSPDNSKSDDSGNYSRFNMNWFALRTKLYPRLGPGDAYKVKNQFTNSIWNETKTFMKYKKAWGRDFYKIHRGGESGLHGGYASQIADYEDAIKFMAQQLKNNPKFRSDDTRVWVEVPYI